MFGKDLRRHPRLPHLGPARISWEDAQGTPKYAVAKCLEVSESGMCIETSEPIPVYTSVSLRSEPIKVAVSATVKHISRNGSKYILGLEMSQRLRDRALNLIRM